MGDMLEHQSSLSVIFITQMKKKMPKGVMWRKREDLTETVGFDLEF